MKRTTREKIMLVIGIVALLLAIGIAAVMATTGCMPKQTVTPSQLDRLRTAVEGYGNTLSIHTEKFSKIESHQTTNNPWPYVVIVSVIVIAPLLIIFLYLWFSKSCSFFGRKTNG